MQSDMKHEQAFPAKPLSLHACQEVGQGYMHDCIHTWYKEVTKPTPHVYLLKPVWG